jgi:hypothetical protein
MKKEEKLTENIIAILELNKRKWDEEHPSKHDEKTIKNLVDKHQDVPKLDKRKAKDVSKVEKHYFPKFEKELKKDKLSIVSFRIPIALKETIDYYCEEKGINRTDYFHGFLSEFKTISLELFELKKLLEEKENKEKKETENKDSKSFAETDSESVAESKSKNIVLNISSSINLNVSNLNAKETINLTINVS